ncbi:MAG: 50S ribosomal protein L25 [Sedimentisphaerales bacterium]|jgi:large subunit ribosomal protein L25|nr:50S ribosomal protein L25 [Sedimentisphaerales bacterium]NLZ03871.1 50S ribosomal protein L25 [Phycisphaerae bacterium]HNY77544.1 50S ribosomal protein L25 [Sedimentisphaerales bacterium]HOC61877.1 50S ribosomal protein L25 [Sedimentisphaerales bacterium]HOH63719.1 50S ribosomal protein L25 [Sedimentisphaerales bacterium]
MDKTLLLEAQIREHTGSKAAARVRKQGQIPGIVYGHKQDPVAILLNAHDFSEGLHHGHRLMDITVGGKTEKMIVKELQYDHLGRNIVHVDLMRVDVTEAVRVSVPIELKGTAKGTHEGGIVEQHASQLEIECLVTNMPESIVVSVKELGVGQAIHAGEVALPEGVTLVSPPEMLLAACHVVAAAKTTEELEAETPVAPEVIGEKKEEPAESGE